MRYPGSEKLEIIPYGQKTEPTAGTSQPIHIAVSFTAYSRLARLLLRTPSVFCLPSTGELP
jgi:hypothetical protein